MAEINGLEEPWIRARDARWGVTDDVLNQSMVPTQDICVTTDPHALVKDRFEYDKAHDRMKILSVEFGSYGVAE
eukprot:9965128-Karenia_brevis.AAC.1